MFLLFLLKVYSYYDYSFKINFDRQSDKSRKSFLLVLGFTNICHYNILLSSKDLTLTNISRILSIKKVPLKS